MVSGENEQQKWCLSMSHTWFRKHSPESFLPIVCSYHHLMHVYVVSLVLEFLLV